MASRKLARALRHKIPLRSIHGRNSRILKIRELKKVLIVGSGAIKIGEAGEFDYSTSQAIKALREAGNQTVLVSPNVATIDTDKKFAHQVDLVARRHQLLEQLIAANERDGKPHRS